MLLKHLVRWTAQDEASRPTLHGVSFREGEALVADGFRLLRMPVDVDMDTDVTLDGEDLRKIKTGNKDRFNVTPDGDHSTLTLDNASYTVQHLDSKFPDFSHVYPKVEQQARITIDPVFLKDLADLALAHKGKGDVVTVTLDTFSDTHPMAFKVTVNQTEEVATGLIMPVFYK